MVSDGRAEFFALPVCSFVQPSCQFVVSVSRRYSEAPPESRSPRPLLAPSSFSKQVPEFKFFGLKILLVVGIGCNPDWDLVNDI